MFMETGQNPNPTGTQGQNNQGSAPQTAQPPGANQSNAQQPQPAQQPGANQPNAQQPQPVQQTAQQTPSPVIPPASDKQAAKAQPGINKLLLAGVAVIVIVIIAGVGISFLSQKPSVTTLTSTSSVSTTTAHIVQIGIAKCMNITSPGVYYLSSNISTDRQQDSCIIITTGGVTLLGGGKVVRGAGPYSGIPPYTKGIAVYNSTYDSISNVSVKDFSYGIYLENTANSTINDANVSSNAVHGLFLLNSDRNSAHRIIASNITGQGALYLIGSSFNNITGSVVRSNAQAGIYINGTNNRFFNDTSIDNQVDLLCQISQNVKTNIFASSTCSTNFYCSAANCYTDNVPPQLSDIKLGNIISTCGGIYGPGNYTMSGNINALDYLNGSNSASQSVPCITINAPNVRLNCNHYGIENGGYGIYVNSTSDIISNCNIENSTYGLFMKNNYLLYLLNSTLTKSVYGVFLSGITTGTLSKVNAYNDTYGIYLNDSQGVDMNDVVAKNNTYGVYVAQGSHGNAFQGSLLNGNKNSDLYCDVNSYNGSGNLFSSTSCGTTDCSWGSSCSTIIPPPTGVYQISSCGSIKYPGIYTLQSDIIESAPADCISIDTNNVNINCNGNSITGGNGGNGFYVNGRSNITISDCILNRFSTALNITNSSEITLNDINQSAPDVGAFISNVSLLKVVGVNFRRFAKYGFVLNGIKDSLITSDTADSGLGGSSDGFVFDNSTQDIVSLNGANNNQLYGFLFQDSGNNQIFNNTALGNNVDYKCSPQQGIYYEQGSGINFGSTKQGCIWLVEQNNVTSSQINQCFALDSPQSITLAGDMVYKYGSTCYDLYGEQNTVNTIATSANNTVINCDYHTVLSTSGGTFADVQNLSGVRIENCYLKGFTNGIVVSGMQNVVQNNTFASVQYPISENNTYRTVIRNNNMFNSTAGIFLGNAKYGTVENNMIVNTAGYAVKVINGIGSTISSNFANMGKLGMYMQNNTQDMVGNNYFINMSTYGISCGYNSNTTESFIKDLGGNVCSSNNECVWMSSSTGCRT